MIALGYNGQPYAFELDGQGHLIDPSTGLSAYVAGDTTGNYGLTNAIQFEPAASAAANSRSLLICSVAPVTLAFTCYTAADSTANVFYLPFLDNYLDLGTVSASHGYNSQTEYLFIVPAC
jgi:hypothetical protein